jgi:hypothetical protein
MRILGGVCSSEGDKEDVMKTIGQMREEIASIILNSHPIMDHKDHLAIANAILAIETGFNRWEEIGPGNFERRCETIADRVVE